MSVPTKTLGELVEVLSGFAFESERFAESGDLPIVRIRDVVRGESSTFYRGSYDERFVVRNGDVLIGMDGEFNRARWRGGVALLNQRVCRIVPVRDDLDDGYLFHFLPKALKAIENVTPFVTVKHLSAKQINEIRIPVPPVTEQRRIAHILDRADALRAKRRAALALLDTLPQSIFLHMFGDPATNPMNWPMQAMGEVAKVVTGNTPPRAEPRYYGKAIEWIKSDNIDPPNSIVTPASEGLSAEGRLVARIAPPGATLITCIAGSPNSIGNAAMTNREVAFNQQINALIPRGMNPRFLYGLVTVGKRLIQGASTSAMKGMVTKSRLQGIEVFVPPTPEQERFATRASAVDKLKAAHRASLTQLDALFASLQHRAFRGEL